MRATPELYECHRVLRSMCMIIMGRVKGVQRNALEDIDVDVGFLDSKALAERHGHGLPGAPPCHTFTQSLRISTAS